ncbi:MAG: hypothetical protein Q3962_04505 [Corynebacterium sp.]|nr:hypothetical protein [Corynebacterium sp.]
MAAPLAVLGTLPAIAAPLDPLAQGSSELPALVVPTTLAPAVRALDLARCPAGSINHVVRPGVIRNAPVRGDSLLDTSFCLMSIAEARQVLFDAVNEYRIAQGIVPLIRTEEADEQSQAWASSRKVMAGGRAFSSSASNS